MENSAKKLFDPSATAERLQWWNQLSLTWKDILVKQIDLKPYRDNNGEPIIYDGNLIKILNITTLQISNMDVIEIDSIWPLIQLKTLYASSSYFSNINVLASFTELEVLSISDNPKISDLSPLYNLPNFHRFSFIRCANLYENELKKLQKAIPHILINI